MSYSTPDNSECPFQNPLWDDRMPESRHVKENYKKLIAARLWNNEDEPETPYCDDVSNTFYGSQNKK